MNTSHLEKIHYINIEIPDSPTGAINTSVDDINNLFSYLSNTNQKKLTIHFHGGLVSEENGVTTACHIRNTFSEISHPLTFIWETGFKETLLKNLEEITETKLFQKILEVLSIKLIELISPSAKPMKGKIEEQLDDISEREARKLVNVSQDVENIAEDIDHEIRSDQEIDNLINKDPKREKKLKNIKQEFTGEHVSLAPVSSLAFGLAKITVAVIQRYIKKSDHGLRATTIEEILRELYLADFGEWTWSNMKKAAENMWQEGKHGHRFLQGLVNFDKKITIDIIGHSAGSIAICHMLKKIVQENLNISIRNVFFLAPACTNDLFCELIDHEGVYENFRMFTMSDKYECLDGLPSQQTRIYPRSLLYFISGILEDEVGKPIAGLHRHIKKDAAPCEVDHLDEIDRFLNEERLTFSVTGGNEYEGKRCSATTHGGFHLDPQTKQSLQFLISKES
ncbi:alpha/beta hydrolase [Candidatus Uabimicrobium sp. HlEnr_7]|uniref:alpha/beta hydrolase n=1 Tax=Candidatus Uabimicrobium helgolandensis TaxID=3095367 RepID=UPI003556C161